jgi:hypothetical protein
MSTSPQEWEYPRMHSFVPLGAGQYALGESSCPDTVLAVSKINITIIVFIKLFNIIEILEHDEVTSTKS